MARDIAVFVGEDGNATSLYEKGKIIIFQKRQGKWKKLREKTFTIDKSLSLKELRAVMTEAMIFLADCKIFVGQSLVGVPYFELEKAGFSIWEFDGQPMEFLDYVLEKEEEAQINGAKEEVEPLPVPVDLGNGHYSINLKKIQQNNSGFTSKQVLMPFVKQGKFYQLEIICSHIPPWLEMMLQEGNLIGVIEKISPGETKVTISKTCHQC